jgi:hypothetical protein
MGKQVEKLDALKTLGKLLGPGHKRDAVHVAVVSAMAAEDLQPGQHVGFVLFAGEDVVVGPCDDPIGIVDPFIQHTVLKGQRFWLFIYPRTITSLRHAWTHPAFDDEDFVPVVEKPRHVQVAGAMGWINGFADNVGVDKDDLLSRAEEYLENGSLWVEGGRFEDVDVPDEFWDHYEVLKETRVSPSKRGSFFSCSCG